MTETELKATISLLHTADDKKLLRNMTDEEWQEKFAILKAINIPNKEKRLSRKCGSIRVVNRHWTLSNSDTGGDETLDSYYVKFINDVLKVIRGKGKNVDCVTHIYQVGELLRFEPNLQTKLIHSGDGFTYIEVWLEKGEKK